ncbi:MAG: endonuclease NucS domain-containing protein [Pseudomonadota bacterium]
MPLEHRIRDQLAENLDLIGPGLSLIDTEYPVKNALGAGGKIDILARDHTGMLVVIEVKRSDQTARTALHELHKYTALLGTDEGHAPHQIRCVLASTDWHELLVPFSEYKRHSPFHMDGLFLELDGDSQVAGTRPVEPVPGAEPRRFCPHHLVLFVEGDERDSLVDIVAKAMEDMAVSEFFMAKLDVRDEYRELRVHRHALYVVLDALPAELDDRTWMAIKNAQLSVEELDEWEEEQVVLHALWEQVHHLVRETEWQGPPALAEMLNSWDLVKVNRFGRHATSAATLPDLELLAEACGVRDGSQRLFLRAASTRIPPAWDAAKEALFKCLDDNRVWFEGTTWFLDSLEDGDWSVSFDVLDPVEMFMAMTVHATRGDPRYLPTLDLVAVERQTGSLRHLAGGLVWDGETTAERVFAKGFIPHLPDIVQDWARSALGQEIDVWNLLDLRLLGLQAGYEHMVIQYWGLSHGLFLREAATGDGAVEREVEVVKEHGEWGTLPLRPGRMESYVRWCEECGDVREGLLRWVFSQGMLPPEPEPSK